MRFAYPRMALLDPLVRPDSLIIEKN